MKFAALVSLLFALPLLAAGKPTVVDVHVGGGGPNVAVVSGTFGISEEGKTEDILVSDSPHEKLTLVSKRAIAQWTFKPGASKGKPAKFLQDFIINYHYTGSLDKMAELLVLDQEQTIREKKEANQRPEPMAVLRTAMAHY